MMKQQVTLICRSAALRALQLHPLFPSASASQGGRAAGAPPPLGGSEARRPGLSHELSLGHPGDALLATGTPGNLLGPGRSPLFWEHVGIFTGSL